MVPGTESSGRSRRLLAFTGPEFHSPLARPGEAMAVLGDRVLGFAPVDTWRELGATVLRLEGEVAIPGLNDAHMHPAIAARDALAIDLSPASIGSRAELGSALREAAERTPEGEWIRGSRYDPSGFADGPPLTRRDLDEIAPRHPLLLLHTACHWGVANSIALRLGGLATAGDAPPGGKLGEYEDGSLDGVLYEQAIFDYVDTAASRTGATIMPQPTEAELMRSLGAFLTTLNSLGITSATDALSGPKQLRMFADARAEGVLSVRLNALLAHNHLDRFTEVGIGSGFGDEWLRIGGYKAFVDGAVAGRTCLVDDPFLGSDDTGIQIADGAELIDLAARARKTSSRLAVHANGDAAIRLLADVFEADVARHGPAPVRHRVEHCSIPAEAEIARLAALGVIAVPFGAYAMYHGRKVLDWYGAERAERMFPHRALLDAGITVAGSSDFPCGPYEPMLALRSCITRRGSDGAVVGASQRISFDEALECYTHGSALASGEQDRKGRLLPGMLADFAVFDRDLARTDPEELTEATVTSTWVGGEQVWAGEA